MARLKISVSGNKESYQLTRKYANTCFSLDGDFQYNSTSKINFNCDGVIYHFGNINLLQQFCEKIRGLEYENMFNNFIEAQIEPEIINSLSQRKQAELGLMKSLFLIYHWVELPLMNPADLDVNNNIYNEFIVDWSNQPEPQKDIYFIDKKYINTNNQKYINKLVEFNLLACLTIERSESIIKSYFIPLVKPGLSRNNYQSEIDPTGSETYSLWKVFLEDRNNKIDTWLRKRI
jgi:hypothetical protein